MPNENETTKTIRGPGGIRIELDRNRVVLDDPGQDTPALVYVPTNKRYRGGDETATFWCAMETDELDLTKAQRDFLIRNEDKVNDVLYPRRLRDAGNYNPRTS